MKKLLCTLLFLAVSGLVPAQTAMAPEFQPGKIWFKIKDNYSVSRSLDENPAKLPLSHLPFLQAIVQHYGVQNLSLPFWQAKTSETLQRTYLLEFSQHSGADALVRSLEKSPYIEYAEKVPLDRPCLTPNDPSFASQWGLSIIGAPTAWNYFSTGSNIVIAIVDDAVLRTHADLSPNLWVNPGEIAGNNIDDDGNGYIDDINGYDVGSNDNNPNPTTTAYDHGTHVAGIASARSNNGTGVASIGFSCKLMCVKSTNTASAITNGYDGIVYAAASGADVINMSWGGPSYSTTGQNVINYAWSQGCVLIAASGNDNVSSQFYPAAFNNVVSVSATTNTDTKASFSNYGSWIDISAPGNNIYSTTVNGAYGNKSGTSMASPMVAGLAGLMWSLNPGMTKTDLISCLLSTATSINAQNPGYNGQLGSGRINAAAAMQCVSATLNNAPVADFTANFTTVTAGGQVAFSDMSVYNPTTWTWSFPGGTPASYNGQTPPPIVYNTPGTYNVSLTASNANGSDTETKTSYIQVTAGGGCFAANLPIPAGWTLSNYYTGATVGADGWINGVNVYQDKQKAMYFDLSAQPYTFLTQAYVAFGLAYSANPAKIVPVRIYDGTSGSPGAQLGVTNLTMGQIMADVNSGSYSTAEFASPITLPASKRFFVSVDLTNLQWTAGVKDTLSIVSNSAGQTTPSAIWEQQSNNVWYQYGTAGSWNLNASLIVHPFLTNQPALATFTSSATTVCAGDPITFDAAGSTYQDTLLWSFPGGNTTTVSQNPNPTIYFNTPGTYTVKLYVVGGGCSQLDSAQTTITVNARPSVSVSAPQNYVCAGNSITLTASGATSYTWSPGASLNTTTGNTVIATPAQTTTYNVQGSLANGCSNIATVQIQVQAPPVAQAQFLDTTISCGTSLLFDGLSSDDVDVFAWTFSGGTPATSNAGSASVSFGTPGAHPVTLTVSNSCGTDVLNSTITVDSLNVSVSATQTALCEGSSTTLTATGATSYNWSPGATLSSTSGSSVTATPVQTTTYTVTGTTGTCPGSASVTIQFNPLPHAQAAFGDTTLLCGNTLSFDASASTHTNGYAWTFTGGSPASAGSATQTVDYNSAGNFPVRLIVSNGCGSDTLDTHISVTALPLGVTATQSTICEGSSTTLNATGATSYSWSPATGLSGTTGASVTASPVQTVTYTVTGSNGSCSANATVSIQVNPRPTAVNSFADTTIDCGGVLFFDASATTNAANYTWSFAGGSPVSAFTPTASITYNTPGTHTVIFIAGNNCGSDTLTHSITVKDNCLGLDENGGGGISAYYAPGLQQVVFSFTEIPQSDFAFELTDMSGKVLDRNRLPVQGMGGTHYYNVDQIAPGVYTFRLYNREQQHILRFVKNQ
ncbi:MAG: S8 family serine peptidase [Bacteroidia bacterium]|nr:S8 family serine peptidase [Bacteroidia bacterium]